MFGMMLDIDPKFYSEPSPTHVCDLLVKVTDFYFGISIMFKFVRSYIIQIFCSL